MWIDHRSIFIQCPSHMTNVKILLQATSFWFWLRATNRLHSRTKIQKTSQLQILRWWSTLYIKIHWKCIASCIWHPSIYSHTFAMYCFLYLTPLYIFTYICNVLLLVSDTPLYIHTHLQCIASCIWHPSIHSYTFAMYFNVKRRCPSQKLQLWSFQ